MIEKIASHLGDFSPRLQSNTRALYQVGNFFTVDSDVQKILDYKLAQFLHAGLEFVCSTLICIFITTRRLFVRILPQQTATKIYCCGEIANC